MNDPKHSSDITTTAVDYDPFANEGLIQSFESTEAQREIWTSIQMGNDASCAFNESITLEFKGGLKTAAMTHAINALVGRHDSLRATFTADGKSICVADAIQVSVPVFFGVLAELLQREAVTAFDLEKGPLFRCSIVEVSPHHHYVVMTAHHIICDGWSLAILVSDLGELYSAFSEGRQPVLESAFPFQQYAEDEKSRPSDEQYWLKKFTHHIPQYDLPADNPRPLHRTFVSRRLDIDVDLDLIRSVKASATSLGCSLSAYMLSAYFVCLRRWSSESLLAIGIPTAGQPLIAPETLVGHCVNMLPITTTIEEQQSFAGFCKHIAAEVLSAYEHQNFTYGSLVKKLSLRRDPSRIPLLSVLFNVDQGIQGKKLKYSGLDVTFHSNPRSYENFEIFINASDYGERFIIECQYNTDLFDERSARSRIDEYIHVLSQLVVDVHQPINRLVLVSGENLKPLLKMGRGTESIWPAPLDLAQFLAHKSIECADKPAIITRQGQCTYKDLNQKSNQFASVLVNRGIQPGTLVGVCMSRSRDMMITLLGILKAGAAYVPLDPEFPVDRLAYMIENSEMQHLVFNQEYRSNLPEVKHMYCAEQLDPELSQQSLDDVSIQVEDQSPAYVIYTSGSTGKPKGVVVPRGAVSNFLRSMAVTPGIKASDVLLAVTTLSFDIAVLELYLPLVAGATVIIADREDVVDGHRLLHLMREHGVTFMQATPATWRMLLAAGWKGDPAIKALCGGEALPKDLAAELVQYCAALWNMYGPTETTVWSTCSQVTLEQTQSNLPLSIGKAIANTTLYVVDEMLHPVPVGIAGELLIGGEGVASGYFGRSDLSAERFIACPDIFGVSDGCLYRTGDKVRFRVDGELEYLGRIDQQIKIRGFRIELGEIESLLRQHPAVQECAVTVHEKKAGDARLVAFIVWQSQSQSLEVIRNFLGAQLPGYMLPQHVETIPELPRTLNGKLDRKMLATLDVSNDRADSRSLEEPKNDVERKLQKIWQSVLGTRLVGTKDNFFDLGGHSLLIAQIIQQVEAELEIRLDFRSLYLAPTIIELAKLLKESDKLSKEDKVEIMPLSYDQDTLLSLAQQRLWYLNKINESSTLFNLPSAFRLFGALNREALQKSFDSLVERHHILRARIIEENDVPYLRREAPFSVAFEEFDLSAYRDQESRESSLADLLQQLYSIVVEFDDFPLFRVALIQLGNNEHVLFFMPHHLIFDGWSFDIVIHEISTGYARCCGAEYEELTPLPIQYADYAHWMRQWLDGHELKRQIDFWKEKLSGPLPKLEMPTDFPRPDIETSHGAEFLFNIEEMLVDRLTRFALEQDVTLFMVMMTAYIVLLNRYTGQEDIIVGAPMADRTRPGTQNLVGFFVNALPVRVTFQKQDSFLGLLKKVKESCLEAFNNQDAPFEKLVEVLNPERDLSRATIFQTSVTYQDISRRETAMGNLEVRQIEIPSHDSPLDLNIWFKRRGSRMQAALVYTTALFERESIQQLSKHFVKILEEVLTNWHQPVNRIPLLDRNETSKLLQRGEGPRLALDDTSLSQFLLRAVQKYSNKPAVHDKTTTYSYGELDFRSNQFASVLKAAKVGTGDRVGICMSRSSDLLVALLGILKAGAAYVPLDPDFPDDRLAYMVEDSGLSVLVCEHAYLPRLPEVKTVICFDQIAHDLERQSSRPVEDTASGDQPAYIIYTSGSTGKPKGVVVPRKAMMNFLLSMAEEPGFTEDDTLLAVTTLSFDISVLELFLPLIAGGEVIVASREEATDGRHLSQLLTSKNVTIMQATPATWRLLLGMGWQGERGFKILCGGEALPKDLAGQLLNCCGSLWNMYGPTETTVWSTCAQVKAEDVNDSRQLSLGNAIANTQIYIVDDQLRPLPCGIPGELLIGGEGVTLGYYNRQELTAEKFIERPPALFGYSGKLYRTGDKARFTHDGRLEYHGRLDQQVKIRGYRIELGEIETVMRKHPDITDCAVTVKEERAGDARLVAFVVWAGNPVTLTELRTFLKEQLPAYMIPQHLETLVQLPRTLNDKLDRKALAEMSTAQHINRVAQPPQTDMEKLLAELWSEVTGTPAIARNDNFFDVGGHSLLSMQVIHTIEKKWGVVLRPRVMLIEDLQHIAKEIDEHRVVENIKTGSVEKDQKAGASILGFFRKKQ